MKIMNKKKTSLIVGSVLLFILALSLTLNQFFRSNKFIFKNKAAEVSPTPTFPPYVKGEILVGINPNTLNAPTTQNSYSQSLVESGSSLPPELSFLGNKAKVKEFTDLAAPAHKIQNKSANFQNVAPESKEPDLMYKLVFDENTDIQSIISDLKKDSRVTFAEPNYVISIDKVANDPDFNKLWNLQNTGQNGGKIGSDIKATQAWDTSTDAPSQIIAVIDTGIDYNHLDLLPNIYTNQNEKGSGKENNGVDDDGNGFIDDYHGWNFINNTNNAQDDNGHGTHQ
jgi:subtilisin family serine protease